MKPLLLIFLCLAGGFSVAAETKISSEAQACFAWFRSLGHPDLRSAEWVEAVVKSPISGDQTMVPAFLLGEDAESLTILPLDLAPRVLLRNGPLRWEKKSFLDRAAKLEEEALLSPTEPWEISNARPDFRMGTAARTFLMAYACWAKGYPEQAQRLFDTAQKIPSFFRRPSETGHFRKVIEAELAHAATWAAVLDFGEAGDTWDGQKPESPSRAELLQKFQDIEKKFPNNPHAELVKNHVANLRPMVDEDRNRPPLAHDGIARLPIDQQVDEWIFQLRDQTGRQITQPGSCDVFDSLLVQTGTSPAHELEKIGFAAVPKLLAVLDDERPSRSVTFGRRQFFSHRPLTIGECAKQVLNRIARRIFPSSAVCSDPEDRRRYTARYRDEVTAWWNEAKESGETADLEKFVRSGAEFPYTAIERLRQLDPVACEQAVLAGARASGGERWYLEALCHPDTPARRAVLQELMHTAPTLSSRALAATRLRQKFDESASAAMLEEWKKRPLQDPPTDTEGFETLARFLVAGGEPSALQAIEASWPNLRPCEKAGILRIFGENLSTTERVFKDWGSPAPPTPDAVSTARRIFRAALDDPTPADGFMLSGWSADRGPYSFSNPRLCDFAVFALEQCFPKSVHWQSGADETTRGSELSAAKKFVESRP